MATPLDIVKDRLDTSALKRPRHKFKIPKSARSFPGDPHEFVLVPFTLGEELDAMKAAAITGALNYELMRLVVVEIDGAPAQDGWLDRTSPRTRNLIAKALDKITMGASTKEEMEKVEADFFASEVMDA